ncbi:hypothetical protein AKJ09_07286 [Labilithrix luteola]|uniref:Uncharacterized protein n=1 Tax=Labilithrix luteola TaxID=1391654 RepID=A0A0K1Q4F9_9BACT|nr:hypothetical protein AKJ09_07286 [Labilithrix luteola]
MRVGARRCQCWSSDGPVIVRAGRRASPADGHLEISIVVRDSWFVTA